MDRHPAFSAALAAVGAFFKAELIRRHAPWRTVESVELATLSWVDWWNHRRLHGACNDVPPAEFEAHYYAQSDGSAGRVNQSGGVSTETRAIHRQNPG